MLRVNGSRSACKAARERVSLSRLSRVDAQLVEPDSLLLLRESPTDAGHSERQSDERENLPFQHFDSPCGTDLQKALRSAKNAAAVGCKPMLGWLQFNPQACSAVLPRLACVRPTPFSGPPPTFAVIHHSVGLAGGVDPVDAADDNTRVFARPTAACSCERHGIAAVQPRVSACLLAMMPLPHWRDGRDSHDCRQTQ